MAALASILNLPSTALTAGVAKTVMQVHPAANQRVKLLAFGLYTDGVTATAVPIQVQIIRQGTAGTATAGTLAAIEPELTETIQTTASTNATAEPTTTTVLETFSIPAFMGQYEYLSPQFQELIVGGGGYLGITVNAPAAVNIRGYMKIEE